MTAKKNTEILSEIVELLTPLESAERMRVIQASLTLLGESFQGNSRSTEKGLDTPQNDGDSPSFQPRTVTWMNQNGISVQQLEQVFHIENGTAEVILAEIPGKSDREKVLNAYVLTGLANFISNGGSGFEDKSARAVCKASGCYDENNHASYIREKGSEFTGSKEKGWILTSPGLKKGAQIVKEVGAE